MYVKFENGAQFTLTKYPTASSAVIANHRRDVLGVTVEGEHADVKATFGQPWSIVDGENVYDKSNYTMIASICDNMDGTFTVRVGRQNTAEETLRDENHALQNEKIALQTANAALVTENAELSAQMDELIIEVLEGGSTDVSETEETV